MFVSQSTIVCWESGARLPDAPMSTRLAKCLWADTSALFQLVEQSEESTNIIIVGRIILYEGVTVLAIMILTERFIPQTVRSTFSLGA